MDQAKLTALFETYIQKLRITPAWDVTLEQTVEELAKCFLLEFGEDQEFSYGRCRGAKSFNDLYDKLKNIE